MAITFEGQVAIVTGAGRGIGRAHAMELAARGAKVVVNDLDAAAAAVVDEIVAGGGEAVAVVESVATAAGGESIVSGAVDAFGTVDVLINNAGARRPGGFAELSVEDIDVVLDSHLRAGFFVTQPAWRVMAAKSAGRILFTSSSAGMLGTRGLSNYAAAKAGLYGLTKALAAEGAEHGIGVNCIIPFAATRPAGVPRVAGADSERSRFISDEEIGSVPPERADPALAACLAAYLCSAECTVSGEAFSVCNGRYARVYVGVAQGWLAPSVSDVTAESIAAHMGVVRDLRDADAPMWLFEELASVARRVISLESEVAP